MACCAAAVCLFNSCASPDAQSKRSPARLLTPLEFSQFTVRTNLNKAAATTLMREKVKVGSTEDSAYLF